MNIKYAFSRPTSTAQEEGSLMSNYRQVGYDGLQLKWGQYVTYLEHPERFIERWGSSPGIGSALITGGTLLDEDSRHQLRKLYAFAREIGTELIVYCHGISRAKVTHEDIRSFAKLFEGFAQEAEQEGLRLSLHHHYDNPLMHREDFDAFFGQLKDDSPIGLTIDTAHLVKSGVHEIAEVIRSFAPFIDNFHMKDFSDGNYQILGRGEIDFSPVFQAIRDISYEGWISADEESGGDVAVGMNECLTYMKKGMEN